MRIDSRYAGPPGSANGGVTCGLLAEHIDAAVVEVTLHRPPPLNTELHVADGSAYEGDLLLASGVAAQMDVAARPAVGVEQATAAAAAYAGRTAHPFPGCFVCGIDREPPDGLGLRPGPVGDGVVAAVWVPASDERFLVWAALDCPGGWAAELPGRPMVLGRMALEHVRAPLVGTPHVVLGWVLGTEGRKTFSATGLYDAAGAVVALARQTWLTVDVNRVGRQG